MNAGYGAALGTFKASADAAWAGLPFFQDGTAEKLVAKLDAMVAVGTPVLPPATDIFKALLLTRLDAVRVVILGQDPYPTPGDAHGLAFSVNLGVAIPRSLGNIFKERQSDLGLPPAAHGNLTHWAQQGVLLLNTCLSVEAGQAGSHRRLGWQALMDQVIGAIAQGSGCVFLLWGADAQAKRGMIGEARHCVIATAHPSPLSARRGFFGSHPFSRANRYLKERELAEIDWSS